MHKVYDINCPYCQAGLNIKHDDGYGREENELYQQECSHCNKIFVYTTDIIYIYNTQKADCLNDGEKDDEHEYELMRAYPGGAAVLRCTICGDEKPEEVE